MKELTIVELRDQLISSSSILDAIHESYDSKVLIVSFREWLDNSHNLNKFSEAEALQGQAINKLVLLKLIDIGFEIDQMRWTGIVPTDYTQTSFDRGTISIDLWGRKVGQKKSEVVSNFVFDLL